MRAILGHMVRTGARVNALRSILRELGHVETRNRPPLPRLHSLPVETATEVVALYRSLGGVEDSPKLAPGSWDIVLQDGPIVELDEDMHFHRYRAVTLDAPWAARLPWTESYRGYTAIGEAHAGTGGRRWTNPSAQRMFGGADPDGVFGSYGAPRWKQRALYDSMKDASAAVGAVRLARLSIFDLVEGHSLNDVLYGRVAVNPQSIAELLEQRTSSIVRPAQH